MRYDPADYLYASARIRALESRLVSRERLLQLSELSSADEILTALAEYGFSKELGADEAPDDMMRSTFAAVSDAVPQAELIRFLRYPYDCHNLKTIEKCRLKGVQPDGLLIDLGTVSLENLQTHQENEHLSLFPTHMAAALTAARESYQRTGDPREIDFALDKALYEDMLAAATVPFARDWLLAKADLANLMLCLRLMRMQSGEIGKSALHRAALPIGSLAEAQLASALEEGENGLEELLKSTPYADIFEKGAPFSQIEKAADDYLTARLRTARSVIYGAEVPLAYLLATETVCKNVRILLTGKRAGLSPDIIKERMRACYV